jgi:hypothetical protein
MVIVVAKTGEQLDLSGGKIYLKQAFGIDAPRDIVIGRHYPLNKRAPITLIKGLEHLLLRLCLSVHDKK